MNSVEVSRSSVCFVSIPSRCLQLYQTAHVIRLRQFSLLCEIRCRPSLQWQLILVNCRFAEDSKYHIAMATAPKRMPLTGSCHCASFRYIVFLTLPHPAHTPALPPPSHSAQRFYRCNCTLCHKLGHFHIRPGSPVDDFIILSPENPITQLSDYQHGQKTLHFYSCKTCGVHCFIFAGELVLHDVEGEGLSDVPREMLAGQKEVWRPKRGGGHPRMGHYLSVNGHTVDAKQDAFDMRVLTESESVMYCDCFSDEADEAPPQYGRPQRHGSY